MSDLFDYLHWRGDLPLSAAVPLNEVDGMILARVAYFPFELFNWSSEYTLPELCQKVSDLPEETMKLPGDLELRKELSSSPRFSSCFFSDYQKNFDSKATEQFAAITIHLNEKEMCLAFCGTDATLVGWKEDLNMSFMVCVPSQGRALQYAEEMMTKYPKKKVYMVGHSKGGNLACYATAFLPTGLAQRVLRVYSYDGPGFSETVIQDPKIARVRNKVQLFMPQDSIVGRIMNQIVEPTIVHSTNESIYQHDVYSWEVLGPKLQLSPDGATDFSTATGEAIKRVLSMTDPVQRKAVIDIVFDFLGSSNAHTVAEVRESMSKNMLSYLKALQGLSGKQVGEVMEVVSFFINAYASIFAKRTTDQAKQSAKTFWEQNVPEGARNVVESAIDVASTIPIFQPKDAEKSSDKASDLLSNLKTAATEKAAHAEEEDIQAEVEDHEATAAEDATTVAENATTASEDEATPSEVKKTLTDLFEKLRETLGKEDCQKETTESEDKS